MRAPMAGRGPALCGLVGCRRERGRAGKVAAIAPCSDGDVVAAEWSVNVWHRKSGLRHFRAGDAPGALKVALSTGLLGSTLGRLPSRRQQRAELTPTAAASGKQRRLGTAHNARTIRRNLRYVRPETEGRGSAPRTCSCRQYFCQAPWQRLSGGGRYGTSPSPRPATGGPGRLGCHLRDSRSRTINVAPRPCGKWRKRTTIADASDDSRFRHGQKVLSARTRARACVGAARR